MVVLLLNFLIIHIMAPLFIKREVSLCIMLFVEKVIISIYGKHFV